MNSLYIEELKKWKMIGKVDPWKSLEGHPVYALLVPVSTALDEINARCELKLVKADLVKCLKENDIFMFKSIEDFVKLKNELNAKRRAVRAAKQAEKVYVRNISPEHKEKLRKHAESIRMKKKGSTSEKG